MSVIAFVGLIGIAAVVTIASVFCTLLMIRLIIAILTEVR